MIAVFRLGAIASSRRPILPTALTPISRYLALAEPASWSISALNFLFTGVRSSRDATVPLNFDPEADVIVQSTCFAGYTAAERRRDACEGEEMQPLRR